MHFRPVLRWAVLGAALSVFSIASYTAPITPKMQPNIDQYKRQAVMWASEFRIVQAVKEANAKGPIAGLDNAKWRQLKEADPVVQGFITSPSGEQLMRWMEDDTRGINKLVLSGAESQRVAFTAKPTLYFAKGFQNFDVAMNGEIWQQSESKPDSMNKIDTVQIAVPVKDDNKVIGVLLVYLKAENLKK